MLVVLSSMLYMVFQLAIVGAEVDQQSPRDERS